MKTGEKFNVDHRTLLDPLVGRLVTLQVDGKHVHARIHSVLPGHAVLTVVPESTKE